MTACWKYDKKKFILQVRANTNLTNLISQIKQMQNQQSLTYFCPSFLVQHLVLDILRSLYFFDEMNICSGDIKTDNVLFYYSNVLFWRDNFIIDKFKFKIIRIQKISFIRKI